MTAGAALPQIRFALVMGLGLVMVFGVLDAIIQPTVLRTLWIIRYGVMTAVHQSRCTR